MVVDGGRNGSASVGGGESSGEKRGGESGSSSHCIKRKSVGESNGLEELDQISVCVATWGFRVVVVGGFSRRVYA